MGSIPSQERHVDPFSSFNSDTVNKLTQMITRGSDALTTTNDLDVLQDSTSPTSHVVVTSGFAFRDDVLIEITDDYRLDFTDSDCYVSFGTGFDEDGWYAIVLEYTYVKSRPAPTARLKILKPSQIPHPSLGVSLSFLKAVKVTGGGPHIIDVATDFLDYYPDGSDPPDIVREYTSLYFGVVYQLPTHDPTRDEGRVVYESSTDTFWFGFSDRWGKISAGVEIDIDTTGLVVGELCYADSDGKAASAIATSVETGAEMAVAAVGTAAAGTGRTLMSGFVSRMRVQSDILMVTTGDLLYLSTTEAGRVTNVIPTSGRQVVGRALSNGSGTSSTPVDGLFFPRDVFSGSLTGTIEPSDWSFVGPGSYREIIDISALSVDTTSLAVLVNVWDAATDLKVSPADVELSTNGNFLSIYTSDNTVTWSYIISTGGGAAGAGGGGGGGGITDHDLLNNLTFAASGHTGFASDPHGNGQHSATFITASGVTKANLDANGDVGTGSGQVSQGDHVHATTEFATVGFVNRTIASWASITSIDLTGARYHHDGSTEQIVGWGSDITFTFGPAGSNPNSSSLGTEVWQYLYIDDSAIISSTLTDAQLVNRLEAPDWTPSKLGWYRGNDRCIGAFYVNLSGEIDRFSQTAEKITWDSRVEIATSFTSSWTDTTALVPFFEVDQVIECSLHAGFGGNDGRYYWKRNGSPGSGHIVGYSFRTGGGDDKFISTHNTFQPITNSGGVFEMIVDFGTSTNSYMHQSAYFLPQGM